MGYKKTAKERKSVLLNYTSPWGSFPRHAHLPITPKGQNSAKGPELCDCSACPDY